MKYFLIIALLFATGVEAKEAKKNRLSWVGGFGPSGEVEKTVNATGVKVETQFLPHVGLQYQRSFDNGLSIGIQGTTNKSGSLLLGFDF